MKLPDLDPIRHLLEAHRAAIVSHGQQAFVQEDAAEARLHADRLDQLNAAELALGALEESLAALGALPTPADPPAPTEKRKVVNHSVIPSDLDGASIFIKVKGIVAGGTLSGRQVTVLPGSQMALEETADCREYIRKNRRQLIASGKVVKEATCYRFSQPVTFSSPSAAACAILGRSSNGPQTWVTADGKPIGIQKPKPNR